MVAAAFAAATPAHANVTVSATRPVMAPGPAEPNSEILEASVTPDQHYMVFSSDA